ncbi:AgrD protein [Staphylococcus capitis]
MIMNSLFNLIFKFFTVIFEFIGLVAGANPCQLYYDEPEVPEELSKLYE